MKETLAVAKALADENRLRIIMMVKDKEVCVCQIVEVLGNAASTVSKHLSILKNAGLLESYKQGRWIYYRLPAHPSRTASKALSWVMDGLESSATVQKDRESSSMVCSQDPETLTKLQRAR